MAFEAEPDALREAIEQLDPDELSPNNLSLSVSIEENAVRNKKRAVKKFIVFYDRSFIFTNFLKIS